MKKWLKITLISSGLALVLGVAGFFIWKKFFDKPIIPAFYPTVQNFTMDELNTAISKDYKAFDTQYIYTKEKKDAGKDERISIIGIKGKVTGIDKKQHAVEMSNDAVTITFSWDMENRNKEFEGLELNKDANIKGIYTGSTGFNNTVSDDPMELENHRTVNIKLSCINN